MIVMEFEMELKGYFGKDVISTCGNMICLEIKNTGFCFKNFGVQSGWVLVYVNVNVTS